MAKLFTLKELSDINLFLVTETRLDLLFLKIMYVGKTGNDVIDINLFLVYNRSPNLSIMYVGLRLRNIITCSCVHATFTRFTD